MIPPEDQTPEAVLAGLDPILPLIFRSMEAATQEGREFFDLREAELDPFLFPNLVRYYAKGLLDARGLHAVDDPDALSRADIANNGLLFTYRAYLVRILKADHGALPAAGISLARQDFFEQLELFKKPVETLKLVILWDLRPGVLELRLVCPKEGSRSGSDVHWDVPIPHPGEASVERHDDDEDHDLPIRLDETGTNDE